MTLTVLQVAFPFAPVHTDAVGGAEQMLALLDQALVAAGHRSVVLACAGSAAAGELIALPAPEAPFSEERMAAQRRLVKRTLDRVLQQRTIDVVHMHGLDFHTYLPEPGTPVLISLHCPAAWHPAEALRPTRPRTYLHAMSARQHATMPPSPALLDPIPNGVAVPDQPPRHAKRSFALVLARICPEKGVHLALEAAYRADVPLLIGGAVYPYPEHLAYFEERVRPLLDHRRRFLGAVGGARKRRLLAAARCLLVPSLAEETSSLVAREALAAGTPVIAFPNGALVDTIDEGKTGFLVDSVEAMATAILAAPRLDRRHCWETARRRFSLREMVDCYVGLYASLASGAGALRGAA